MNFVEFAGCLDQFCVHSHDALQTLIFEGLADTHDYLGQPVIDITQVRA